MSCPFLTCTLRGPHEHMACEDCGAVRHGSLFCLTCLRWNQRLHFPKGSLRTLIKIAERRAAGRL
jgi:hypothetical protein